MPPLLFPPTRLRSAPSTRQMGNPRLLQGSVLLPGPPLVSISGVSRDSTGGALGNVVCTLFRVNDRGLVPIFTQIAVTTSDGSGNYSFPVGTDGPYRVMFDIQSPARAGVTDKTLVGV